jgi:hypothetical protein
MEEEGGAAGMEDLSPQGPPKGRKRHGGKPQGEPAGAQERSAPEEDSGAQAGGPAESEEAGDVVEKADEGRRSGRRAPEEAAPAVTDESQSRNLSELLRFERKGRRRRR